MLWIGWFGLMVFCIGRWRRAAMALLVTGISAAVASFAWMIIEWKKFGRPSLVGIVTGMVAGLATVTPASGFIGARRHYPRSGGYLCYVAVNIIRNHLHIDDSLDVFAVHVGVLLVVCWSRYCN